MKDLVSSVDLAVRLFASPEEFLGKQAAGRAGVPRARCEIAWDERRRWNDWGRYFFEGALAIRRGNLDSGLRLLGSAVDARGDRVNDLQYPVFG